MYKKIIAILTIATILLTLSACGKKIKNDEEASVIGVDEYADSITVARAMENRREI